VSARKENFIINLKEINNRTGAEGLKGQEIYIDKAQLKNLENEEWYHEDLIGLNVQTSSGNEFGKIQAIFNFGAGDILEIKLVNNKIEMIPFNKDFVLEIILNDKIIISDMETK
jgi:16S rRNA processing protein RimM